MTFHLFFKGRILNVLLNIKKDKEIERETQPNWTKQIPLQIFLANDKHNFEQAHTCIYSNYSFEFWAYWCICNSTCMECEKFNIYLHGTEINTDKVMIITIILIITATTKTITTKNILTPIKFYFTSQINDVEIVHLISKFK